MRRLGTHMEGGGGVMAVVVGGVMGYYDGQIDPVQSVVTGFGVLFDFFLHRRCQVMTSSCWHCHAPHRFMNCRADTPENTGVNVWRS